MAETTSIKSQAGKNAEQSDKRLRDPVRQPALSGGAAQILALQKTIGNQAVSQLLQSGTGVMPAIQTKLMINQPGDKYEQEADRIAELVTKPDSQMNPGLSTGPQQISRKCSACASGQKTCSKCADEEIQRKPITPNITPLIQRQSHGDDKEEPSTSPQINHTPGHTPPATTEVQSHIQSLRTGGQPLPGTSRAFFESRLHYDFGQVRTHTGPQADQAARAVNARAFTIGRDVVFGSGQYAPETNEGQRLLAHELTHVVQQTPPSSPASSTIQRQAASTAPTAGATPNRNKEATTAGMIVEDTATDLLPGQMKKTEFLVELRAKVCRAAEAVLAKTGRTTEDCPYLNFWFDFYGQKESRHIEGAIHKYEPETSGATTASAYIPLIVGRVRRGVEVWAKTGQITGIPEDMPTGASMPGSSESGGNSTPAKGSIQFKAHNGGARGGGNPQAIKTQLGAGSPLDGGVRSRMESAYGRSFSHVRVHTDTTATALSGGLNARAFTVGEHIAFDSGEYQPGSLIGDAIIAHELAHVMQQESAPDEITPMQVGKASYDSLENDADQSAFQATVSLWGRAKEMFGNAARKAVPRMKSGLSLQACKRTVPRCPTGKEWQVVGQPAGTGPVCWCVWRCLPGSSGSARRPSQSTQSSVNCYPGPCPKTEYEDVDDDYEIKVEGKAKEEDPGSKIGVGGHLTPVTGTALCGCIELDIEGGEKTGAPLREVGIQAGGGGKGGKGKGGGGKGKGGGVKPLTTGGGSTGGRGTPTPPVPAPTPGGVGGAPSTDPKRQGAGSGGTPPPSGSGGTPPPTPAPTTTPPTTTPPAGTTPPAPGTTPAPTGPVPTKPVPKTPVPAGTTPATPGTTPAPTTTGPTPASPGLQPPTRTPGQGITVPGKVSWGNPASRPAYGHSQSEHGAKRPAKELQGRANSTKDPQGQYYDNKSIVEAEQRAPLTPGAHDVPMGRPVGRVYVPNAAPIENVTTVRVVRKPDLTVRTSFPIN